MAAKLPKDPNIDAPAEEPVDHVDLDPTTGESIGTHADPEGEGGGRAAPDTVATTEEQGGGEEGEAEERPLSPPDRRASELEKIAENARKAREAENAKARELEAEQIAELERQAGAADEPDSVEDEAEEAKAAPSPDSPSPDPQDDDLAKLLAGRKVAGKVGGKAEEFDAEAVFKAGLATLQKERAGDHRIAEARAYEEELRAYHAQLNAYRENLTKGLDETGQPLRPSRNGTADPGTADKALPDDGAPAAKLEDIQARALKAAQALYNSGDTEAFAKEIASLVADAPGRTAIPKSEVAAIAVEAYRAESAKERAQREAEQRDRERQEANRIFRDEFKALHDDDDLFALTQARVRRMQSEEANAGKPLPEIVREAAKYVHDKYLGEAGASNAAPARDVAPAAEHAEARRRLKARTPLPPSGSATVRHQPPPPPKAETNSAYIARMRAARRPDQYPQQR